MWPWKKKNKGYYRGPRQVTDEEFNRHYAALNPIPKPFMTVNVHQMYPDGYEKYECQAKINTYDEFAHFRKERGIMEQEDKDRLFGLLPEKEKEKKMGLFNQKDLDIGTVIIDNTLVCCDMNIAKYIGKLERENHNLQKEKHELELELKSIKPVLECQDLKPAVSKHCQDCKYVALSTWNRDILGCRKDALCKDFEEANKND